ncbi:acyl carrier protein [Tistrella bauzanensis]
MTWSGAENGALRVRLAEAPPAIRRLMLVDDIMARLRDALALEDDAAIGPDDRFKDLGIDSRRALEMKEDLEEALGHPLQTTLMFDYPTPTGWPVSSSMRWGWPRPRPRPRPTPRPTPRPMPRPMPMRPVTIPARRCAGC